jgi:pimeloyl-ACP methyl ester carboxylesterase
MPDRRAPVVLLPGILMPAAARYAPLAAELPGWELWPKELEVYAGAAPPDGYGIGQEVAGLLAFADARGAERFHLYGHSAGGAIALAFAAEHGDRLFSLALDEPATDFSAEDGRLRAESEPPLDELPVPERMAAFARMQVRPEVELPAPPSGPPSPETAKRPAGVAAFRRAIADHRIDEAALTRLDVPVYFSYGSLSHPRWEAMAGRMRERLPRVEVERYEGLHHMNTSHAAEPARVAAALERLWTAAAWS